MYLRWAERHRFPTEILDQQEGEQAGLKSVTVAVNGRRAYGWLRAERGVHRLVRISPFDSSARRHTSFGQLDVGVFVAAVVASVAAEARAQGDGPASPASNSRLIDQAVTYWWSDVWQATPRSD